MVQDIQSLNKLAICFRVSRWGRGLYTVLYGTLGPIHAHVYSGPLHRSNRAAMLIFNDFIVFFFSVREVLAKTTPHDTTHMPLWRRVFLRQSC